MNATTFAPTIQLSKLNLKNDYPRIKSAYHKS